jgi:hypothetical protein
MSRPAKIPAITFEGAMTVHVLRSVGVTYGELCMLLGENSSRISQILDGELHRGSWEAALAHLARDEYWHPRIVDFAAKSGGSATLLSAAKAADPATRRHRQMLKRLRKVTIPFSRRPSRLIAKRA